MLKTFFYKYSILLFFILIAQPSFGQVGYSDNEEYENQQENRLIQKKKRRDSLLIIFD